eukprot:TRINITY_DN123696_c0_g1_i1.p1 TRINITY_DN123696_c0_g1~~TRINITY_DN123696_c0_g1_i1.p1  ORF type:complete len:345 (-),score=40.93 TRINITY_DN123696_c0_g1_i1:182-1216(-)
MWVRIPSIKSKTYLGQRSRRNLGAWGLCVVALYLVLHVLRDDVIGAVDNNVFLQLPAGGPHRQPLSGAANKNAERWQRAAVSLHCTPSGVSESSSVTAALKSDLFVAISNFDAIKARDGSEAVDFGVKGGELDKDTRAPRNLAAGGAFYKISDELGQAADNVFALVEKLTEASSLAAKATSDLGTKSGSACPLHGQWKLLFTTAADASFSKNSSRGDAQASNIVDGVEGTVTNIIDFKPSEDGKPPVLEQLRVRIAATALSESEVGLQFKYVKARVTKFFGLPLFGRRLTLTLPVPGPFLTSIICFFTRKKPPKAFFKVLYLDENLRIHRTGEGNLFVQQRMIA